MTSKTAFKTIEDFLFQENKTFVIPNYQRGYKWAVKEKDKAETAVEKLLDNFLSADKNQQYFLQGVTVVEENDEIILIDGQQRTTTLYLLLYCLGKERINNINLKYDIRKQSKEFILNLKKDDFNIYDFDNENKSQDIFYFKKAIEQINLKILGIKTDEFKFNEFIDFLLKKVTILYIVIDKDKATKTFTMMNGSKATMLQEELVKAEMLRKVSRPDFRNKQVSTSVDENLSDLKEIITKDWETNALRSRYAREWDKWLYWWNREDVKTYFNVEKPIGLLLDYYLYTKRTIGRTDKFSFEGFRILLSEYEKSEKRNTKIVFKELRDLQKSFEDIFSIPNIFNHLGLALIDSASDKLSIIAYFIDNKKKENNLKEYAKLKLVGSTHKEIIDDDKVVLTSRAIDVLSSLNHDFAYEEQYVIACKQLLRLNVEEDNKLNRKFDFKIWQSKSLEHIFPKSKVYHINEHGELVDGNNDELDDSKKAKLEDGTWLNRADFENNGTEHCIGNLVLLYGKNNSEFGAKMVTEKKQTYFNIHEKFESRHLLHTISVFAQDTWSIVNIQNNRSKIIKWFKTDYTL